MMGTVDRLLKATEDIWASYHEKPFVQGLKYGTLDQKKFRSYIIQDYWYLMDYTKVFAIGVAKSKSVEVMKLFAKYIQAILDGEVNVHNGYMADFGITQEELDHTPIQQDNRSYTSYMLSVAYRGGEAEILTAISRAPHVRALGTGLHHSPLHRQQRDPEGYAGAADQGLYRGAAPLSGGDLYGVFPL